MKFYKIIFTGFPLGFGMVYLGGALSEASFNLQQWSPESRGVTGSIGVIIGIAMCAVYASWVEAKNKP